jgi:hypothetical protein
MMGFFSFRFIYHEILQVCDYFGERWLEIELLPRLLSIIDALPACTQLFRRSATYEAGHVSATPRLIRCLGYHGSRLRRGDGLASRNSNAAAIRLNAVPAFIAFATCSTSTSPSPGHR